MHYHGPFRKPNGTTDIQFWLGKNETCRDGRCEWTCPSRYFLDARRSDLATGYYNCREPVNGGLPRCQLEFGHWYQLGPFLVPAMLLPVLVVIVYTLWYFFLRESTLAQLLGDDQQLLEQTRSDEKEQLPEPPANAILCSTDKTDSSEKPATDTEAQKESSILPSRFFKDSGFFLQIWSNGLLFSYINSPDNITRKPPIIWLTIIYPQVVVILLLDGMVFNPRFRELTFMLAFGWLLLFLRDVLNCLAMASPFVARNITIALLGLVFVAIPWKTSTQKSKSIIPISAATALVIRACIFYVDPPLLRGPKDGELQFRLSGVIGYITFVLTLPLSSVLLIWSAVDYLKANPQLPISHSLAKMARKFVHDELPDLVQGLLELGVAAAMFATTAYLASCMGLRRILLGNGAIEPTWQDPTGVLCGFIWALVVLRWMMLNAKQTLPHRGRQLTLAAVEAIPKTLAGLLVLAAVSVAMELWNGDASKTVIYPQAVFLTVNWADMPDWAALEFEKMIANGFY